MPSCGSPSAPGKVRPATWKPAHTASTTAPCADAGGERAVVEQRAGGAHLRPVLSPAEAVDVRLRHRRVRRRLDQFDVAAAPLGAPRQDQPVAAVPVRAQEVREDHRHAQDPAHAGAPSKSWNAV